MQRMSHAADHIDLTRPVEPMAWSAFRAEFLATYSFPAVSKPHASSYRMVFRELEALNLAGEGEPARSVATTADLTSGLVTRYLASLPPGFSAFTVKKRLVQLQTIAGFAELHRWLTISPFRLRRVANLVKTGKPVNKRAATREEIRAVFDLMRRDIDERRGWGQWRSRRLFAVTALVAYTGLRKMEALRLHVSDLDLDAGIIHLIPHGKGFKTAASAQPVPMPPALIPVIRDFLDHRLDHPKGYPMPDRCDWLFPTCNRKAPWTSGCLGSKPQERLRAVGIRAGVPDIGFHMLRRSWATHAEFWGIGPSMIQRVLRHSNPQTTETFYRKADARNMIEAVKDVQY